MKARKISAMVLALLMLLALLNGCSGREQETPVGTESAAPATEAPSTQAPAVTKAPAVTEAPQATAEPEDEGPYHFAKNYATDSEGWPLEKYVYEQPICDTDEVFTRWTTCYYPQYLTEGGFNDIETWQGVAKYTGVHIEYNIVDSANRQQNFSVLLASDDLDEILDQGSSFYPGSIDEAMDEGYFADMYDYRHLMPNYMREIKVRSEKNPDCMDKLFYKKTHLCTLYGLVIGPVPSMGSTIRQDWLDRMDMGSAQEITTFDKLHDALYAMKVNFSNNEYNQEEIFPFYLWSCGEITPGWIFPGYNTALFMSRLSNRRVVDGEVQHCGTTEDDRALMTMLAQWYAEGLISPNFQSYIVGGTFDAGFMKDMVGCMPQMPGSINMLEANGADPNTHWEPIPRTKLYDGQILEFGNRLAETHNGFTNINAKCHNLELAAAYLDWWMSDFGGDYTSWGPEGWMWDYNENGEKELQDWVINHEATMLNIMNIYSNNNLVEFCLHDIRRSYAYPEGKRPLAMYDTWVIPDYGGHYDWPSAIILSDEDTEEATTILADLNTYFSENYVSFINGVKPLSEWDNYLNDMKTFGLDRLNAIYQAAYDEYIASR